MRGKGIGQPEDRRELRAIDAGAQHPDFHLFALARDGAYALPRFGLVKIIDQFDDIVRKSIRTSFEVSPKCPGRRHIGARRSAKAEIDSAWVQRRERSEMLGDD